MKKLLLIFLVSCAIMGCKKCVTCTVTCSIAPNHQPVTTSTSTTEICGTTKDIEAAEKAGNSSAISGSGSSTTVTTTTTQCK